MVTTGTRGDKRLAAPFVLVPTMTPIKQFIPLTLLADIRPHLPCCLITALDHNKKKGGGGGGGGGGRLKKKGGGRCFGGDPSNKKN